MTTIKKTRRESLRTRLAKIARDGVNCGLDGCPVGGWAETRQAIARLVDDLPFPAERNYTVHQIIDALYTIDHADRYQIRAKVQS